MATSLSSLDCGRDAAGVTFATLLRSFRLACGLSQQMLAERAGLSAEGVSVLERGARRAPHRRTLAALADALALSPPDRARLTAAAMPRAKTRRRRARTDASGERHNLPLELTSFVGRERESAIVRATLAEHRLVTITGVGGVGKTRLGLEVARALIDRFPDGVWLVELATSSDPSFVARRIAASLGVSEGLATDAGEIALTHCVHKELLLLLDNCEHVLDIMAPHVQRLLQRCSRVRALVTSQEPLRIRGERVVRLDPLDVPRLGIDGCTVAALRESPAIKMFFDRARDAASDFAIDDADVGAWEALQRVCERLDGIPLAIELAAAHMHAMNLETLGRVLESRFDALETGPRTDLPRHRTLRAMLDWSYGLLSDVEQRVFRNLAVFVGGWTLEAAESICADDGVARADVLPILAMLVEKSLVIADGTSTALRYSLLQTTRAYALERLTEQSPAIAAAPYVV